MPSAKLLALPALLAGVIYYGALNDPYGSFDERVPVGAGGSIRADIELGSALSFDKGSLLIRSHEEDEVRVVADIGGWGSYAVDLDLSHEGDQVELVGRVDGPLDWLFGGPRVDVQVFVPRDFTVEAHIDGGPLSLEDLVGPVTAVVERTDVSLRRAEGRVVVESERGSITAEDVEGEFVVRSSEGAIDVAGVRGSLVVDSGRGDVEIDSVRGDVRVQSDRGRVEVESVRGNLAIRSDRGRVEAREIDGAVDARTGRGGIELDAIDGVVSARSERGSIDVHFEGDPAGDIQTGRGSIYVAVPDEAGFDLDARTERGRIEVGGGVDEHDDRDGRDDDALEERPARSHFREAELVRPVGGGGRELRLRANSGSITIDD